jgi:hypothetical protein
MEDPGSRWRHLGRRQRLGRPEAWCISVDLLRRLRFHVKVVFGRSGGGPSLCGRRAECGACASWWSWSGDQRWRGQSTPKAPAPALLSLRRHYVEHLAATRQVIGTASERGVASGVRGRQLFRGSPDLSWGNGAGINPRRPRGLLVRCGGRRPRRAGNRRGRPPRAEARNTGS